MGELFKKKKLNDEEKLHRLAAAMLEYMARTAESLPEVGKFETHSVSAKYPGTDYEGILCYEPNLAGDERLRRLRLGMHEGDSDKLHSFYFLKGTKAECVNWMKENGNVEVLVKDLKELKEKLDNAD